MAVGFGLLAVGFGCWLLAVGLLAVGCWLLVVGSGVRDDGGVSLVVLVGADW